MCHKRIGLKAEVWGSISKHVYAGGMILNSSEIWDTYIYQGNTPLGRTRPIAMWAPKFQNTK